MADARELAFAMTRKVNEEGGYLNLMLRYGMDPAEVDARDRGLVAELAYGVQRYRNRLDFIIAAFSRRPPDELDPEILDLLRLGVYQLVQTRIPQHAAVNETVSLAKKAVSEGAAAYVNAVMRAACSGMHDLSWPSREDISAYLQTWQSHPDWLVEYLLRRLGPREAEALCAADNQVPSLSLRANLDRVQADELLAEVVSRGGTGCRSACLPEALTGVRLPYDSLLSVLDEGLCVVQDEVSMLVGHVVDPRPGDVVIDACAAPGGKATHLAQLGGRGCRVIAVDRNRRRIDAMRATVSRLGLANIDVREGDSTHLAETVPEVADAVLVDAPCSGLGTLRRNPELKWRRRPEDLAVLSRLQYDLLASCAGQVRPGGTLVYSVCTYTDEETGGVINPFLSTHHGFRLDGCVQIWPHLHHTEGMFIARMVRT